ncbi:MAG TPA: malto-oligosyltrehalose synthase [Stellaceae bacterium]|jgi:(1->4)-alpha-D-glucan 1-alpha-D-glucosylmutase|nr:malto-oligosyltrehalose synthase [Stellaceae bacterium]
MSGRSANAPPIRATYRLQFHRDFTFRDATRLVPYLAALGVSHLYASPITEARPGSTHGYDIVNHNRLNPEVGSDDDFRELSAALRANGMGLIVDFVPNHMGIGSENAWWLDVLEWGQESPFAHYFDINWHPPRADLEGRVLLPVLGDQYGVILEKGEIELRFDPAEGSFSAWYFDHRFPISPRSYAAILAAGGNPLAAGARDFAALAKLPAAAARERAAELKRTLSERAATAAVEAALREFTGVPGEPESFAPLHRLLEAQSYRIADWRVAGEEINYRRFFNINDLAGLRMELPELFETTHRLMFELIERGDLHGLRIDHIDGLFDPRGYCEALQQRSGEPLYVLVEKILARYESLPDWPVAGTTGYDFVNQVLAIFVDPAGETPMTRLYRRMAPREENLDEVLYLCKKRIMQVNLASEMNVLAHEFHQLAMREWRTRDFTFNRMRAALEEVVAAFPVYRTYVSPRGASADDRRYVDWALGLARKRWRGADVTIFDFLRGVLTGEAAPPQDDASPGGPLYAAMHFQQVTGPVMAKAAEDTAFYRYVRMLALNEVGGDPARFGMSVAAFHHLGQQRARQWPQAMVTTATHDTKRGEDARARLALLSEMPREWSRRVFQWLRLNRSRRVEAAGEIVPDRNVEYLFYQSLLGAWPPGLVPDDQAGVEALAERLEAYMIKAVRERKLETSWSNPSPEYEAALTRYVRGVLDTSRPNPFVADFHGFLSELARAGAVTSLAQLVLKLTVPGVPDIYQGGELWDFSLVDPDNRRPVDWDARRALLDQVDAMPAADLGANWQDGREKLFVTACLLRLRSARPELFAAGDYQPLDVSGEQSAQLCAFARSHGGVSLVVAVPRLVYRLRRGGEGFDWGDAAVMLPPGEGWQDVFTRHRLDCRDKASAATLFAQFPVAVLIGATRDKEAGDKDD